MLRHSKRLGEILIDKGLITEAQVMSALEEQKRTREFLGEILIRRKLIKEKDLLKALSEQFEIPIVRLTNKYIEWDLVKKFTPSLILDYRCFPVKEGDFSITIAITNPLDAWAMKKIEEETRGLLPKFVLASREDMDDAIRRYEEYLRKEISKEFEQE